MLFSRSIFTLRIRIPCKRKNASILRKELKHIIICRRPESNRFKSSKILKERGFGDFITSAVFKKCSNVYLLQTGLCTYLSFFKCVVDKSKNEIPNNKNVIAEVVFLSIKFIIDTIKKHIEASKKHINRDCEKKSVNKILL